MHRCGDGHRRPRESVSRNLVSTLIGRLMKGRCRRTIFRHSLLVLSHIHPLCHSEFEIQALCYYVKRKSRIGNVFEQVSI